MLRTFGGRADCRGVERVTFSEPDMKSRRWLVEQMTNAGLDASIGTRNTACGDFTFHIKSTDLIIFFCQNYLCNCKGRWGACLDYEVVSAVLYID